uniref:Alpha/beta hydrolase n=1 Tax=Mycobacterium sp. (strain JLS) TaxID=164757 RepID=A0A5Q5CLN3_MYCSJ
MERIPMWLGIGAVAAGVSAAALAGAGAAAAETESDGSGPSPAASNSEPADPGPAADAPADDTTPQDAEPEPEPGPEDEDLDEGLEEELGDEVEEVGEVEEELGEDPVENDPTEEPVDEAVDEQLEDVTVPTPGADGDTGGEPTDDTVDEATDAKKEEAATDVEVPVTVTEPAPVDDAAPEAGFTTTAAMMSRQGDEKDITTSDFVAPALSVPALPTPLPSPFGFVQQLPPVVKAFGSVVFDILGAVTKFITGPPQLPPGSTVTVRTSTLEIADGRRASADWYFPDTDEPPTRIIYLQHGFLANGTMYSHTAAYLAERTNSVVVAPTLTSNPFRADDFWLGGDPMYRAVAELFTGDREALNASAAAAGYTTRYGATATLPSDFVLVGHSLGGGLVAGASGHYARFVTASGESNHLAGVISLDGVPPRNDIVENSLAALDATGTYIPFLELHAPTNLFNSTSNITQALNAGRAGKFHGVELDGGVHMDSMLGGNPVIQLSAYVVAGFPKPQNPPAAQQLMAGWINDMFADRIDADTGACAGAKCTGIYGPPGSRVEIPTGKGRATARVLGSAVATSRPTLIPVSLWQSTRAVLLPVA